MITNCIAYWRTTMNRGKGVSKAHLARKVGVDRSFVTKLEKGSSQPGAELMLRVARYFKLPVEAVFRLEDRMEPWPVSICPNSIPDKQYVAFAPVPAKPVRTKPATPPVCPAGTVSLKDKSPVGPAAKAVAKPVALVSHKKNK